jgi:hypothetical protein
MFMSWKGFVLVHVLTCEIVCACVSKTRIGQNVFLLSKQYAVEDGFVIHYTLFCYPL